jgi:hypothetical protein
VHGSAASRASNPHPTPLPRSSQRSCRSPAIHPERPSVPAAAPRSRCQAWRRRDRCPHSPAAVYPAVSLAPSLTPTWKVSRRRLHGRWARASPSLHESRSIPKSTESLLADGGLDPRSRSMEGESSAPTWKVSPCIPISRALWKVSRRRLHGSWARASPSLHESRSIPKSTESLLVDGGLNPRSRSTWKEVTAAFFSDCARNCSLQVRLIPCSALSDCVFLSSFHITSRHATTTKDLSPSLSHNLPALCQSFSALCQVRPTLVIPHG